MIFLRHHFADVCKMVHGIEHKKELFFDFFVDCLCAYVYKDTRNNGEWFLVETKREVVMVYAVKCSNLVTGAVHYEKAHDYASAWDFKRRTDSECEPYWEYGVDFETEVVEVDDDFDFENQEDWN